MLVVVEAHQMVGWAEQVGLAVVGRVETPE